MKSKVSLLMLAILAISVLAAFPITVRADDSFKYDPSPNQGPAWHA